jgi:DUF2075 family protein
MSNTKILSHRFVRLLVVLSLLGSLLGALTLGVWAAVTGVTIVSPTTGTPDYVAPGGTFNPRYTIAGVSEDVTVNVYIGSPGPPWTLLASKSLLIPVTNHAHGNVTVPVGTANGKYDLKVEAVGASDTEDDVQTEAVIVDDVAPGATIDPIGAWQKAAFDITGTASDATSGVNLVEVRIQRSSDSLYYAGGGAWQAAEVWNNATDTGATAWATWKYTAPPLAEAGLIYTVKARATDKAGLVTAPANQPSSSYRADLTNPTVAITTPPAGWENSVPSLSGTASDAPSGVASVEVRVYNVTGNRYWNGTIWTAAVSWDAAAGTTAWTYNMPGLTSGRRYEVTAKATDNAGNSATHGPYTFDYDDVEPTVTITTPDLATEYYQTMNTFIGTANDDASGVAKVEVKLQRIGDGKWWDNTVPDWVVAETLLPADVTGLPAWTYDSSAVTFGDGLTYEVSAKAEDNAGNDPWESDQFTIDTTAPAATIDNIADEVGCSFDEISGTSSDATSGVDKVEVRIQRTNGDYWNGATPGWQVGDVWNEATETTTWTYPAPPLAEADDPYTVEARATDNVGLVTAGVDQPTDTFTYDECPTVAFTAPAADANLNDLDEITGTADDPEAVVEVKVQIQKGLTSEYWDGSAWQGTEAWVNAADTSGAGTWATWEYDTSGIAFPDEDYVLRAKSKDDFGQWSAVAERNFTFDATAPSATIYSIPDPSKPTQFAGTANDPGSSGLDEVYVKIYNVDDEDWSDGAGGWGTEQWLLAAGTDDWTYGVPGGMEDGKQYTVSAKAKDKAGNETAAVDQPERTFTYDTDGPSANINLGAGWNLMSLPLIPGSPIEDVLADLIAANKVDWVTTFVWEGGVLVEKKWDPPAIKELTDMTTGPGYWVNMFSQGILVNDGMYQPPPPLVPKSYPVYSGWNMIGYHATTADRLANPPEVQVYLGPAVTGHVQAMYYFDGVYQIAQKTDDMKVGFGYWMALDEGGTIYP